LFAASQTITAVKIWDCKDTRLLNSANFLPPFQRIFFFGKRCSQNRPQENILPVAKTSIFEK
jgi:hypothetical protein